MADEKHILQAAATKNYFEPLAKQTRCRTRMADKSERCVLCLDEKRSPVRITCGHSFCNECLDVYKSYQKYAWANRCPICRGSLKEKRRSVKKSLSQTTNANNNNNNLTATTAENSATTAPIEQIYLLEEFMAMATESDATEEDEYFSENEQDDFYYFEDDEDYDDVYNEDVDYESEHLDDDDVVMLDEVIIVD